MLVRDFTFTSQSPSVASAAISSSTNIQGDFSHIIRAKIRLGVNDLTNGFVPISLFAPPYSRFYSAPGSSQTFTGTTNFLLDAIVAGKAEVYNHWRWVLPKPMYVSPGEGIQIQILRSPVIDASIDASYLTGSFNVRVAVHGELLFKEARGCSRDLPYVSAFIAETSLKSREQDMKNVLSTPVMIQRLVGSCTKRVGPVPMMSDGGAARLELRGSDGYEITNGAVSFSNLFPFQQPAWTFRRTLNPNEQIIAAFDALDANGVTALGFENSGLFGVSIIGNREEPLA